MQLRSPLLTTSHCDQDNITNITNINNITNIITNITNNISRSCPQPDDPSSDYPFSPHLANIAGIM